MPVELSPIIPLMQSLGVPSCNNCVGVEAAIKRHQRIDGWTRNLVVTTLDRIMLYPLPVLQVTSNAMRDMDIPLGYDTPSGCGGNALPDIPTAISGHYIIKTRSPKQRILPKLNHIHSWLSKAFHSRDMENVI